MAVGVQRVTVEQFDAFVMRPENAAKSFEYIGGEIVEVVSNSYCSEVAANIVILLGAYVKSRKLGRLTGADGGYIVAGERYIPDVAFTSFDRQSKPSRDAYNPNSPDLAVEVISPSDDLKLLRIKVVNYLRAGTTVWVVNPDKHEVEVYVSGEAPQVIGADGTLSGGAVLPGFTLAVSEIFPEEDRE